MLTNTCKYYLAYLCSQFFLILRAVTQATVLEIRQAFYLTHTVSPIHWCFGCQFCGLFTEIAIDSTQRYLIVPFVLIGPMSRCQASRSIHPDDVHAILGGNTRVLPSSWSSSVSFCLPISHSMFLPFVIESFSCWL